MKYKNLGKEPVAIPIIGQGTGIGGFLAKNAVYEEKHIRALKRGLDCGMTFIDTAEEYGQGAAEETVGKAVQGMRDRVFIATKFSPENNSPNSLKRAAEGSLRRLKTDYIDLYQMHWPNPEIPIEETLYAADELVKTGKVRYIGVCNCSFSELKKAVNVLGSNGIVSLQVEYNLFDRTIEQSIMPFCEREKITLIAYSPLDQGRLAYGLEKRQTLERIADKYGKTSAQIILKWLTMHASVVAIPNSSSENHIQENAASADFDLGDDDFLAIDQTFRNEIKHIPTNKIRVFQEEKDTTAYKTVEDAISNKKGFIPSPLSLSGTIKGGTEIKPVRIIPIHDDSGRYEYELIEGRVRYWAWVIAHDGKLPIPAYIR